MLHQEKKLYEMQEPTMENQLRLVLDGIATQVCKVTRRPDIRLLVIGGHVSVSQEKLDYFLDTIQSKKPINALMILMGSGASRPCYNWGDSRKRPRWLLYSGIVPTLSGDNKPHAALLFPMHDAQFKMYTPLLLDKKVPFFNLDDYGIKWSRE